MMANLLPHHPPIVPTYPHPFDARRVDYFASALTALDPLFPGILLWLIACHVLRLDQQHDVAALCVCVAFVRTISLARFSSAVGLQVEAFGCVVDAAKPVLLMLWAVIMCLGVGVNVVSSIARRPSTLRSLACAMEDPKGINSCHPLELAEEGGAPVLLPSCLPCLSCCPSSAIQTPPQYNLRLALAAWLASGYWPV